MLTITGLVLFLAFSTMAWASSLPQATFEKEPLNIVESDGNVKCDFFMPKTKSNPLFNDTPCQSGVGVDKNGNCNTTQLCGLDNRHCFMAWRNRTGTPEIVNAGCWIQSEDIKSPCQPSPDCRAYNNSAIRGVFFCCCDGNFCSKKFHLDPPPLPPVPEEETEHIITANPVPLGILLGVLIPALILIVGIVNFLYYRYRKWKHTDSEIDKVTADSGALVSDADLQQYQYSIALYPVLGAVGPACFTCARYHFMVNKAALYIREKVFGPCCRCCFGPGGFLCWYCSRCCCCRNQDEAKIFVSCKNIQTHEIHKTSLKDIKRWKQSTESELLNKKPLRLWKIRQNQYRDSGRKSAEAEDAGQSSEASSKREAQANDCPYTMRRSGLNILSDPQGHLFYAPINELKTKIIPITY